MTKKNDRLEKVEMRTSIGTLVWPKLTEPDFGSDKFPKEDGEFSTKLRFETSDPGFQALRAKLEPYLEEALVEARKKFAALSPKNLNVLSKKGITEPVLNELFADVYDKEGNLMEGVVELKFKKAYSGVYKSGPKAGQTWKTKVPLFDSLGQPFKKGVAIWGGSTGIVSFDFIRGGYFIEGQGAYGLGLKIAAVQIAKLKQGGERDAAGYGFGAIDGGYVAGADDPVEPDEFDQGQPDEDQGPSSGSQRDF